MRHLTKLISQTFKPFIQESVALRLVDFIWSSLDKSFKVAGE